MIDASKGWIMSDGVGLVGTPSFLQGAVMVNGTPNEWTYGIYRWLQASCVVLFPYHLRDDSIVNRLRAINPTVTILLRMHTSGDFRNNPVAWGQEQAQLAQDAYSRFNITHGCFDVEPQSAFTPDGFVEYREYLSYALDSYAQMHPSPQFKLGLPTLASYPGARLNSWLDALTPVVGRFQTVWLNEYWQDLPDAMSSEQEREHPQWANPALGALHIGYHQRFPNHQLIVGEFGNSLHDREPYPGRGVIFEAMAEQYPRWLSMVKATGYVWSVNAFILPGHEDAGTTIWKDWWISELVAKNVGRWAINNRSN